MQTFPEFLMCLLYCFIPWQDVVIITLRVAGSVWKYSHPTFSPPTSCLPLPSPAAFTFPNTGQYGQWGLWDPGGVLGSL